MEKYFIEFGGTATTLAVEKAMCHYIKDKYKYALVSRDCIDAVVGDLRREMEQYLFLHKTARPVSVSTYNNRLTGSWTISVGQLHLRLLPVSREIYPDKPIAN